MHYTTICNSWYIELLACLMLYNCLLTLLFYSYKKYFALTFTKHCQKENLLMTKHLLPQWDTSCQKHYISQRDMTPRMRSRHEFAIDEQADLCVSSDVTTQFLTSPLQVLIAAVPRTSEAATVPRRWQEFPSDRGCLVLLELPFLLSRM